MVINYSNFNHKIIDIIKYPIITDKATRLLENNQYSFIVDQYSNKTSIKFAIEYLFNVKVKKVNTSNLPKKKKRVGKYLGWKPQNKKAIVTLLENDTINLFAENYRGRRRGWPAPDRHQGAGLHPVPRLRRPPLDRDPGGRDQLSLLDSLPTFRRGLPKRASGTPSGQSDRTMPSSSSSS